MDPAAHEASLRQTRVSFERCGRPSSARRTPPEPCVITDPPSTSASSPARSRLIAVTASTGTPGSSSHGVSLAAGGDGGSSRLSEPRPERRWRNRAIARRVVARDRGQREPTSEASRVLEPAEQRAGLGRRRGARDKRIEAGRGDAGHESTRPQPVRENLALRVPQLLTDPRRERARAITLRTSSENKQATDQRVRHRTLKSASSFGRRQCLLHPSTVRRAPGKVPTRERWSQSSAKACSRARARPATPPPFLSGRCRRCRGAPVAARLSRRSRC